MSDTEILDPSDAGSPGDPRPPQPPPGRPGNSWDRFREIGAPAAFIAATKEFLFSPADAYERTHESGDLGTPLLFGLAWGSIGSAISQIWNLLFNKTLLELLPSDLTTLLREYGGGSGLDLALGLFLAPIFVVVSLFVWSAILHLFVMLVGVDRQSEAGFEGTFRAVCYSGVSQIALVIPIFGQLLAALWLLFLQVVGLARLHRASEGRAAMAVAIPVFCCCGCLLVLGILAMVALANVKG